MRLTRFLESTIALLVVTLLGLPWLTQFADAQDAPDKSTPKIKAPEDDRPVAVDLS